MATARNGWFRMLNTRDYHWPWRFKMGSSSSSSSPSSSWQWKSFNLRFALLDDVIFHILYAVEAVVLVVALSCFFLCCGCRI